MPELSDFTGCVWLLERRIADRLTGGTGVYSATAIFRPDGTGLAYHEAGQLKLGDGAPVFAERRYLWRAEGTRIAVAFEDGRPFHSFDPAADAPAAEHACDPDDYRVTYDFARWPEWQAVWTVAGPRKDYTSVSCYSRKDG